MEPSAALVNVARIIQLALIALALIAAMLAARKLLFGGAHGIAEGLQSLAGVAIAIYLLIQPNAVLGMLIRILGGIQTPTMPG